jgi:hypothetical protein
MRPPLTFAEAGVTPGWDRLFVLDRQARQLVRRCVRVDLEAGLCWVVEVPRGRAHVRKGEFILLATYATIREFTEVWKSCV